MDESIEDFLFRIANSLRALGVNEDSVNKLKVLSQFFHNHKIKSIDELTWRPDQDSTAISLIDGVYEIVELFKAETPAQIQWKKGWLENARKIGASPS